MGDDRQMKKIRVGILGVAAAAALCFTAGAVYLLSLIHISSTMLTIAPRPTVIIPVRPKP